ncbi:(2Fe-2S)-binding protein [Actinomadura parmotrematis]|uniref:(2Fe-2S)-binding protein n=1 Tax=Actinomadura parmotrematis TaxID=2864039 RepID=A0ABS7FVQ1_9ACTN|nr:(2Fe-2S)-binding protein [Actinomadura parmotrematis]MBW8484507.1 (2Fe-2S)-binding protein [Actinomadura parmotrematis]
MSGLSGTEAAAALRAAARLGPFFTIVTGPAAPPGPAWSPLRAADAAGLREVTAAYAARLGTAETRVAASILFQGLASRLWSPVLVTAARGIVPDLAGLRWRWVPGEPIGLWLPEPSGRRVDGDAAELVERAVVDGCLRPLREAFREVASLADGLMWGNAASALVGALQPGTPAAARPIVAELLRRGPLRGTGALGPAGFVRRSCCLYYRVPPGGGMCGDCALLPRRAGRGRSASGDL